MYKVRWLKLCVWWQHWDHYLYPLCRPLFMSRKLILNNEWNFLWVSCPWHITRMITFLWSLTLSSVLLSLHLSPTLFFLTALVYRVVLKTTMYIANGYRLFSLCVCANACVWMCVCVCVEGMRASIRARAMNIHKTKQIAITLIPTPWRSPVYVICGYFNV